MTHSIITAEIAAPGESEEEFERFIDTLAQRLRPALLTVPLDPGASAARKGGIAAAREITFNALKTVRRLTGGRIPLAAHLPANALSKNEMCEFVLRLYNELDVRCVLALGGDPRQIPEGRKPEDYYLYADKLIMGLREIVSDPEFRIVVAVAAQEPGAAVRLKGKQDIGADMAFTQYFYEVGGFLSLRAEAAKAEVTIPVVPGLMPPLAVPKPDATADRFGVTLPGWLNERFAGLTNEAADLAARERVGQAVLTDLVRTLLEKRDTADGDVFRLHLYTRNRAWVVDAVEQALQGRAITPVPAGDPRVWRRSGGCPSM